MTDKEMAMAISEMSAYTEEDAYVSDMAISLVQARHDTEDEYDWDEEVKCESVRLRRLWHVCNDPVKGLIKSSGMSQTDFAKKHSIALRTVQHWCSGDRECPLYIRLSVFSDLRETCLLGEHDGNWHMFVIRGCSFYGCDVSDDFAVLINNAGRFIIAKKLEEGLTIGSRDVKEFPSFQDAVNAAPALMDDPTYLINMDIKRKRLDMNLHLMQNK